MRATFDGGCCL